MRKQKGVVKDEDVGKYLAPETKMARKLGITANEKDFAEKYVIYYNAAQAMRESTYQWAEHNTDQASRILNRPRVRAYLDFLEKAKMERLRLSQDRVLLEASHMAFANAQDFYDEDGNLIPPHKLRRDLAASITEVTTKVIESEGDNQVLEVKYKIHDKKGALELIGKNMKMWTDKVENETTHKFDDIQDLLKATK